MSHQTMTKIERSESIEKTTAYITLSVCLVNWFVELTAVCDFTTTHLINLFHQLTIHEESFGRLVLLGYDVTTFIPVTYQRNRLLRPSMEVSSRG
jgi:hypothetical protein